MWVAGDAPGARLDFSAWQQGVSELAFIVDAGALDEQLAAALRFAPRVTRVRARGVNLTALCEGATRPAGKRAASSLRPGPMATTAWRRVLPVTSPTRAWRGSGSVRPMCWLCCLQPTRAGCLLRSRMVGACRAGRGPAGHGARRFRSVNGTPRPKAAPAACSWTASARPGR